jgi:hypothetical protein
MVDCVVPLVNVDGSYIICYFPLQFPQTDRKNQCNGLEVHTTFIGVFIRTGQSGSELGTDSAIGT